ncbi:MAG TPA: hypothetical protein VLK65_16345 [Vicinamibacteria bacterium]|nr:hypothetical protein [Vicinamibacteria bacterium]
MIAGLSTTTLLLAAATLLTRYVWPDLTERGELRVLYWSAIIASSFLYPMALGLGPYDPYDLGFSGAPLMLAGLALLAAYAFIAGKRFLLLAVVAAVLSFGLDLGASDNLWDYLVDPWLFVYACYRIARERFTIV